MPNSPEGSQPLKFPIKQAGDVALAVMGIGKFSQQLGFDQGRKTMLMTTVSELSTNILKYAKSGWILAQKVQRVPPTSKSSPLGILIVAEDEGPGISDLQKALSDHYSTSGTLGLGLPGVKRLMDSFDIEPFNGKGAKVRVVKWKS